MAHFYRVTIRHNEKEARELATSLSKHLKQMKFPSETKVNEIKSDGYTIYEVLSTATPKQMAVFHNAINKEPLRSVTKKDLDDLADPEFKKHVRKTMKSYIIGQKSEMATRKKRVTERASKR